MIGAMRHLLGSILVSTLLVSTLLGFTACTSSMSAPSPAITGLVTTGARFVGTTDATWQVTCEPVASSGAPCPIGSLQFAERADSGFAEWLVPPAGAAWIGMNAHGTLPAGVGDDQERYIYTYRLTFNVTGTPSTASVSLEWACDNYFHGWRLNGGTFQDVQSQNGQWRTLKSLTISAANATFVQGANTVEFRIVGDGLTDGFLVAGIRGSVQ